MQPYFTIDNNTGKYVYTENGLKYELPLLLMLKLKKYFRENRFSDGDLYISRWYLNLEEEDFEQVTITLDKGFEVSDSFAELKK